MRKTIIITQSFAVFLFLSSLTNFFLPDGYYLKMFNCITPIYIFLFFLLYESILLLIFIIRKRKYILFISYSVIIPIIIYVAFLTLFSSFPSYKLKLENYDKEILIENRSFLLGGSSCIFEVENAFVVRFVDDVGGDDGYSPLWDNNSYKIIYNDNGFEVMYWIGAGEKEMLHRYYEYKDGNIVLVK